MKVLVVHRQESVILEIKTQMKNWYVKSFASGLDGLLASKIESFDLILAEQNLPVITGIEMVRSIRNLSLNRHTPVVFFPIGNETEEHQRIMTTLRATLLTIDELIEMGTLQTDL